MVEVESGSTRESERTDGEVSDLVGEAFISPVVDFLLLFSLTLAGALSLVVVL